MREIPVPMNAARVCNAIARIGYEPHSALMDIIDNSVAAGALNVRVIIQILDVKTINQRNNVARYLIVDNGKGMNDTGIENALRLGSDANYEPNSLSKYGMGLKSAGFSLGTRIQVISKKDGLLSHKYFLDRAIIEERGDYVVCCDDLTDDDITNYGQLIGKGPSGTVIEITGCDVIYHTSARTTIEKLKHRLGVTYYPFLATDDSSKRLSITLTYPGEEAFPVQPVDILFTGDADLSFDPDTYTGSKPCVALRENWTIPSTGSEEAPPIKLEVITFPQGSMAGNSSPLGQEDKQRISTYAVKRENKGFFIYRNGRLIRWGDDLDGIIDKDQIGFRARMELNTDHDDLLHVDVSKQRLEMDDETRNNLQVLMRLPKRQADQIFEICKGLLKRGNPEGTGFTETAANIPEEDPTEDVTPPDQDEKKQRARLREEESKKILEEVEEQPGEGPTPTDSPAQPLEEKPVFKKIRYAENFPGMNLWNTQKDPIEGTFVLINRRHAFYQSIISSFDESSPERLAIEALIFSCAVGENKTFENLTDISGEHIAQVLARYHRVLSYHLDGWTAANQQIFEQ